MTIQTTIYSGFDPAIIETRQTPRELIPEYLGSLDVKPRTKQAYENGLRYFFDWLDSAGRLGAEAADLIAYKAHLMAEYAAATVSAYLSAVRGFYAWLQETGRYINIAARIHGAKAPRGHAKDALTVGQARRLLDVFDRTTPEGRRDFAIVNLMIRTGLRTIEVVRADVGDIRQVGEATVLYIQGKGRDAKDDYVILTPEALEPIQAYLKGRRATLRDPLFTSRSNRNEGERMTTRSISRIVKDSLQAAGIDSERITAHSLRHTAVTFALQAGASLQDAQAMARHAKIETTLVYAHNIDRINSGAEYSVSRML